jgi:hypothetical protein
MSEETSRTLTVGDWLEVCCGTCGAETVVVIRKPGPRFANKRVSHCPRCGSRLLEVRESWETDAGGERP